MKLEMFSSTFQKHLIKPGTMVLIQEIDIPGKLLKGLRHLLTNWIQRIVLNGHFSSWINIEGGVRQGFILRSLLFLIYVNNLADDLSSNTKNFNFNSKNF